MAGRKKSVVDEGLLNLQTNEELSTKTIALQEQLLETNNKLGAMRSRISDLVDEVAILKNQLSNTQNTFSEHLRTLAKRIEPTHKW